MKKLIKKGLEIAEKHGIHPKNFTIVYVATIPLAFLSGAWVAQGAATNADARNMFLRILLTWAFTFAPSLYIILFAQKVSFKVYTVMFSILAGLSTWKYGVDGFLAACLFAFFFVLYRLVRFGWKPTAYSVVIEPINPNEHVGDISTCFQEAYGREPWNEHYICVSCTDPEDFDPQTKYAEAGKCPIHNIALSRFWSTDRTRRYAAQAAKNPSFQAYGAIQNGRLIGFYWGYGKELDGLSTFYLDVIFVSPEQRRGERGIGLPDALVVLESRGWSLAGWLLDRIDLPLFVRLYRHHLAVAQQDGYGGVSTRTSLEHPYLQSRLQVMGYEMVSQSKDDATRAYFVLRRS